MIASMLLTSSGLADGTAGVSGGIACCCLIPAAGCAFESCARARSARTKSTPNAMAISAILIFVSLWLSVIMSVLPRGRTLMITDNQRLTKIRMALIAIALGVLLVLALRARAQDSKAHPAAGMRQQQAMPPDTPAVPSAKPDDVKSIDAIIAATYDVISGPAGDRDWDRFRSLFIPEARLIPVGAAPNGGAERYRLLSVEEYVNRAGGNFKQNGFFENEVSRKQEQFGQI